MTLAPPLAALASAGFVSLWARWREGRRGWWLLPVTLALTAGWQVLLVVPTTDVTGTIDAVTAAETGRSWLALLVMGGVMAAVLGVILAPRPRDAKGAAVFGLLVLLATPALWAAETAFAHIQGARPVAALDPATGDRHWRGEAQAVAGLADFLRANQGGRQFLAATANARQAAPLIIATGAPVLALGGFRGSIPVVTLSALQELVQSGQVQFVLLAEPERSPEVGRARRYAVRRTAVQQAISAWVHERGVLVDPDRWHATQETAANGGRPVVARLYDLGSGTE